MNSYRAGSRTLVALDVILASLRINYLATFSLGELSIARYNETFPFLVIVLNMVVACVLILAVLTLSGLSAIPGEQVRRSIIQLNLCDFWLWTNVSFILVLVRDVFQISNVTFIIAEIIIRSFAIMLVLKFLSSNKSKSEALTAAIPLQSLAVAVTNQGESEFNNETFNQANTTNRKYESRLIKLI